MMNIRWYTLAAVLLAAGCSQVEAQSYPTDSSTGSTVADPNTSFQNPAADCIDATGHLNEACQQNQIDSQRMSGRDYGRDASGPQYPASTRSRSSEDASLNNKRQESKSRLDRQLPPEPPTEFQRFVAATTGQVLPIFGASLFRSVPSTFSPSGTSPATADYVIGADDELRIRIWGQVSYSGNLRVDRSGDIYLENVGVIHVAGLTFANLDPHLRAAVSRVYRNFDLSVDIGKIRSIQVYVTGQARKPGAYTISSLSSLVDAIFASGGPSSQGSLRHIQLNRDGKRITDLDLYALLIYGDKSGDVRLLPEDVIFIPPVGDQVAIVGSIHNAGIYELREKETVGDLIDLAGKSSTIASNARISIDRTVEQQRREAMEVSFDTQGLHVPLYSGDIVRIFSIVPAYRKTLTLRGNVANPGHFGWHPGMRLSDLIPDQDSLISRDYWWKRNHLGLPGPEFEPLISSIGKDPKNPEATRSGFTTSVSQETLSNALASPPKQQLPRDTRTDSTTNQQELSVNPNDQSRERETQVGGSLGSSVKETPESGVSPALKTDVRLTSSDIDWTYAVIERLNPETLKTSLLPFDLGKLVLEHDQTQNLALEAGDTVTIFSESDIRVPLAQQTKYVRLEGEFVHAGIYSALPGETLQDLVRRAGGMTADAYLYASEFDRESTRILQQQRIDEYVNRAELEAERGTLAISSSATSSAGSIASTAGARSAEQDLINRLKQVRATGRIVLRIDPNSSGLNDLPALSLENGDRFIVPPRPATINVVGAVNDQNSFEYMQHGTTGQYLLMAGGHDRDSDARHSFIIRANGSVLGRAETKGLWGDRFNNVRLYPGDTIVVPDKTLRPTALRGLLDWTQIFSQLAIGAAAVNVLR